jgi:thiamine biosynthesis lipoprotein ApbE
MHTTKILNLSPQVAFPPGKLDLYFEARNLLLHGVDITSTPDDIITELNITPAISNVSVHHDEDLVVSTARTIASHARPAIGRTIAKLWIVWPSHHMHTLSQFSPRSSYEDTAHSLSNVDGAV